MSPTLEPPIPSLFPYRARPGQERIISAVAGLGATGGALLVDAPHGFGKTVSVLAPLIAHAESADHRILYLVRSSAQELQVLSEIRAISHRLEHPILATGLQGRGRRCLLLENVGEMTGATAEEHGKLCADRKRATERSFEGNLSIVPPAELPESAAVDLTDLDGCAFYARVLQADVEQLVERFSSRPATDAEFEEYCRSENLCPYETAKKLAARSRVLTAPYSFFFHPHVRRALFEWMGVGPDEVDLVLDEAQDLPDRLRDLATVSLPQESVRRARNELFEHGDFSLPDGPSAVHFIEAVQAELDQLLVEAAPGEDAELSGPPLEARILSRLGGTPEQYDAWLAGLIAWGEALRDTRRQDRRLPRSWVYSIGLTLLSWPKLAPPDYVKVITRTPGRALEAFALDVRPAAAPVRECHLSVHLSAALAPLEEYRDALGLEEDSCLLEVPSSFPPERRRLLFDPSVGLGPEEVGADPMTLPRLADRLAEVLQCLPIRTLVLFPTLERMDQTLQAGLSSALPSGATIESRQLSLGDLWRPVVALKKESSGLLLGVSGGRMVDGLDFRDEDLEALVVVGIPYPRMTAKRRALQAFWDRTANGRGEEYVRTAPARRAIVQALGRLIRSEHDRGLVVVLDARAPALAEVLPDLAPIGDLYETTRRFYGRRAKFNYSSTERPGSERPSPTPPENLKLEE
jgi:DNA excision repair protein ERCC-2